MTKKERQKTDQKQSNNKGKAVPLTGDARNGQLPDFVAIENSAEFKELMRKKKRFLVSSTILFLGLYLLFNVVISFTNVLDKTFVGDISWVWVFAFGLFIMTWVLVTVYMKKSVTFDKLATETLKKFNYDEEAG